MICKKCCEEKELCYCEDCFQSVFKKWWENMAQYGHQQAVVNEIKWSRDDIMNELLTLNNILKEFKIRGLRLASIKNKLKTKK